jgi:hypothetical protein
VEHRNIAGHECYESELGSRTRRSACALVFFLSLGGSKGEAGSIRTPPMLDEAVVSGGLIFSSDVV